MLEEFASRVDRVPRATVNALALVVTLLIGSLETFSSGLSVSLLYAAPVALVALRGTRLQGTAHGALVVAVRLASSALESGSPPPAVWAVLNTAIWMGSYMLLSMLVVGLRDARRRLADEALIDPLTGLRNKRALLERLAEEQQRVRRHCIPLTLSYIDLDGAMVTALQERAGCGLAQEVARVLGRSLRATDTVARMGGGEFALLLPETDELQARVAFAKLRRNLRESMERYGRRLEARVGSLTCNKAELSAKEMLSAASELLRRAKTTGEERVERVLSSVGP